MRSTNPLNTIIFLLTILSLASCESMDTTLLHGKWQAVQLKESTGFSSVDLSTTQFSFSPNGKYTYQTNVNYKEAGHYFLDAKYLVTKDTIDPNATKKSVLIEYLSEDSMALKMNLAGSSQILSLKKK